MESGDQELVQVPAALLNSIVASLEALRISNATLAAEVEKLKNISSRFHRFSAFPVEIRNMIWTFALVAPQTHIITASMFSYSRVNTIMDACHEARSQGMKLRLPYYRLGHTKTNYYINPHVDTIWFPGAEDYVNGLEVFCPDCPKNPIFPGWYHRAMSFSCPHEIRLKRLVLNWDDWVDPDESRSDDGPGEGNGSLNILASFHEGPEELLIVVSNQDDISRAVRDNGLPFVKPHRYPLVQLREKFDFEQEGIDLGITSRELQLSWDKMEERLEKILERHKRWRRELRTFAIEGTQFHDPHQNQH
jgi:hypothetical protein